MSIVIAEHVRTVVFDFQEGAVEEDIFAGDHCKEFYDDEIDEKTTHYRLGRGSPFVRMRMHFEHPLPAPCTHLSLKYANGYPVMHEGVKYLELIGVCEETEKLDISASVDTMVLRDSSLEKDIPDTVKVLNTDLKSRAGRNLGFTVVVRMSRGTGYHSERTGYWYPDSVEHFTLLIDSLENVTIEEGHAPVVVIANCTSKTTPRELRHKFKGCTIEFRNSDALELEYREYLERRTAKRKLEE